MLCACACVYMCEYLGYIVYVCIYCVHVRVCTCVCMCERVVCMDGTPLTKARFVVRIREALVRAGVPEQHYSGHSFRIGAATVAAQAGLPDSTIQALGRWSSAAFLRYIWTPRDQLAQYTWAIAGSRPPAPR